MHSPGLDRDNDGTVDAQEAVSGLAGKLGNPTVVEEMVQDLVRPDSSKFGLTLS